MIVKWMVFIALCSCAAPKMNNPAVSPAVTSAAKTPRLPVMLSITLMPESLKPLFRTQVVARGIDTVGMNEGIRITLDEREKAYKAQGKDAIGHSPAKCNILTFNAEGDLQHISRISWKGWPFGGENRPDTSTHYFVTPDSLRSQPARTITVCLEKVLQSRALQ